MREAELRALLRLRCVPRLGDVTLKRLLHEHGFPLDLLRVPPDVLGEFGDVRDAPRTLRRVDRILRTIDALELRVFSLTDLDYPARLRELHSAPVLLFARGDTSLLERGGVAVVGTRTPSDYGITSTELLVSGLARAGVVVWSGGARGIDGVAHATALAEGGATVAVLGCGIGVVYPPEHGPLFDAIAECGLLLSEFLPGDPPQASHFPRRNRILAHMPQGVLVVEARPDGGALITADMAADSLPLMAVPGPIGRETAVGPNRLIQEGAKLVMDVRDVLEEIGGALNGEAARGRRSARRRYRRAAPPASRGGDNGDAGDAGDERIQLTGVEGRVYGVLRAEGQHADVIARRSGVEVGETLRVLLELELAGHAVALGGYRFRRPPVRRVKKRGGGGAEVQGTIPLPPGSA